MLPVLPFACLSLPAFACAARAGRWGPLAGFLPGPEAWLVLGFFARSHLAGFQAFRDLAGLDLLGLAHGASGARFRLRYVLINVKNPCWLGIDFLLGQGGEPGVSCQGIFPALGWPEREVWDLFGIGFAGCPDQRRLLSDYGFRGFPLRKDFPSSGYLELRYDSELCRVQAEPLDFFQLRRPGRVEPPWVPLGVAIATRPWPASGFLWLVLAPPCPLA